MPRSASGERDLLPHRCVGNGAGGSPYRLEAELPEVTVEPIVADYTEGMRQNSGGQARRKAAGAVYRLEHWEFFAGGCGGSAARCARPVVARAIACCWARTW